MWGFIPTSFWTLRPLVCSFVILRVTDLFHPVNHFPVESFLNGDVCHGDCRTRAVPMLLFGLEPDDIARPDFFDGAAPSLYPAEPWSPGRFAEGSDPARLIFMFMLLLLWCVFLPYG